MPDTWTKAGILQAIRDEVARWDALLMEIGEDRMTQPGVMGDWTFKDLVAHLTGWRTGETLVHLDAARRGEKPGPPPWPSGLTTDEINQWIYDQNRERPLQNVLQESRQSFQRLEEALAAISEEDLTDPNRYAWMEGEALGPSMVAYSHWEDEHEPDIRAWMRTL